MEVDTIERPGCSSARGEDRGRRVDRKGLDGGRYRDKGSKKVRKEGGSETERMKEEAKEGGRKEEPCLSAVQRTSFRYGWSYIYPCVPLCPKI